jgi:hypothetical protein
MRHQERKVVFLQKAKAFCHFDDVVSASRRAWQPTARAFLLLFLRRKKSLSVYKINLLRSPFAASGETR